jgi:hypothetical protein
MTAYIEIRERLHQPSDFDFRYVLRADVPEANQQYYAKDINSSDPVLNGSIVEREGEFGGVAGMTVAQVKTALITMWQKFQDNITNEDRWNYYGVNWNGTSWSR